MKSKCMQTIFENHASTISFLPYRLKYLKRFWNGIVIVLVLVLNFESFFCDLLASVCLVNKIYAKVSIKTKTKTMSVQNLFRYISLKSSS